MAHLDFMGWCGRASQLSLSAYSYLVPCSDSVFSTLWALRAPATMEWGKRGWLAMLAKAIVCENHLTHSISIHLTTQAASSSLEGVRPCCVATPRKPGRVGPLGHHAASCIADGAGSSKVKAKRNQVSWWEKVSFKPHVYFQYRICRLPCKNCAQKGLESSTWKPCWGKVNRAYMLAPLTPSKRKTCHGCVADGDTPLKQPKDLVWGLVFPVIFLMRSRNIHTDTNIDRSLLGWFT